MLSMLMQEPSPQMAVTIIIYLVVLLTALPFHETAHGWIAYHLGDPTAKRMGRLTLNPIKHLEPVGAFLFLLTGFGFAKPVPVDPRYFKNKKSGMALTALAGPVANLLLAWVSLVLYKIVVLSISQAAIPVIVLLQFLKTGVMLNLGLAAFNLLPIPPLDGSKILAIFLSNRAIFWFARYERYISLALMAMVLLGFLDTPLIWLRSVLFRALDFSTGFIDLFFAWIS